MIKENYEFLYKEIAKETVRNETKITKENIEKNDSQIFDNFCSNLLNEIDTEKISENYNKIYNEMLQRVNAIESCNEFFSNYDKKLNEETVSNICLHFENLKPQLEDKIMLCSKVETELNNESVESLKKIKNLENNSQENLQKEYLQKHDLNNQIEENKQLYQKKEKVLEEKQKTFKENSEKVEKFTNEYLDVKSKLLDAEDVVKQITLEISNMEDEVKSYENEDVKFPSCKKENLSAISALKGKVNTLEEDLNLEKIVLLRKTEISKTDSLSKYQQKLSLAKLLIRNFVKLKQKEKLQKLMCSLRSAPNKCIQLVAENEMLNRKLVKQKKAEQKILNILNKL